MPKTRTTRFVTAIDAGGGEMVPAVLQMPSEAESVPAVLMLHGFSSHKERMANSLGAALVERGIASLAIDLPLHGAREGGVEGLSLRNPLGLVQKWKLAIREANAAIDVLATHPVVDARRIAVAGYSLGAYLAMVVAGDNVRVGAVALVAGGDLPEDTPFASLVRIMADPRRAARALEGRPLLMVNGRHDRTITPAQARSLFDAAREPKEMRWYNGGHWPPQSAIDAVATWLSMRLVETENQARLA